MTPPPTAQSAVDVRGAGNPNGRLLTADELAERWQVPKSHVYRLAREGRVPVVRIGRYFRFRAATIDAWEQAQEASADA